MIRVLPDVIDHSDGVEAGVFGGLDDLGRASGQAALRRPPTCVAAMCSPSFMEISQARVPNSLARPA